MSNRALLGWMVNATIFKEFGQIGDDCAVSKRAGVQYMPRFDKNYFFTDANEDFQRKEGPRSFARSRDGVSRISLWPSVFSNLSHGFPPARALLTDVSNNIYKSK